MGERNMRKEEGGKWKVAKECGQKAGRRKMWREWQNHDK